MRNRSALRPGCREGSRWLLLAALVYAPWDYGGTTEQAVRNTTYLLSVALGLWILGLILGGGRGKRRRDLAEPGGEEKGGAEISPVLLVLTLFLLVFGWWMVANARTIYDSDQHIFVRLANLVPALPGSLDQALSMAWMWRATTLLGTVCLVAETARDQRWLLRLWTTMAATGGSIAFLGLVQKATGARMIFWEPAARPVETFFATFFYHGNAGAFLDLTLPVTIGLGLRAFTRPHEPIARAFWLTMSIMSLIATFANTSRTGQFLGAAIAAMICARLIPAGVRVAGRIQWTTGLAGLLALCFALYAVIGPSRLDRSAKRWEQLSKTVSSDARWSASKAAWRALPDAGWWGFGPGTFRVVFPYYSAGPDERLEGKWRYLHQDYLQTLMEWGWLGGGLIGCVFFGGMIVGARNLARAPVTSRRDKFNRAKRQEAETGRDRGMGKSGWRPRQRLLLPLVILGLMSVALYALVDFPLQVASIQLYVAVYLGICWGSNGWGRETGKVKVER